MSFKTPAPKKEDSPKHRIIMEATAIARYVGVKGKCPHNREELVKWVKEQYGSDAEVS